MEHERPVKSHASLRTVSDWIVWAQSSGFTDLSEESRKVSVKQVLLFVLYVVMKSFFFLREGVLWNLWYLLGSHLFKSHTTLFGLCRQGIRGED